MTTVRSLDPSSVFDILILAPESCLRITNTLCYKCDTNETSDRSHLISLILAPPLPIIHPIRSFGIVSSDVGEGPPPAKGGEAAGPGGGRMFAK